MATQAPQTGEHASPLVIRGRHIREVTVCNTAAERVSRTYSPRTAASSWTSTSRGRAGSQLPACFSRATPTGAPRSN